MARQRVAYMTEWCLVDPSLYLDVDAGWYPASFALACVLFVCVCAELEGPRGLQDAPGRAMMPQEASGAPVTLGGSRKPEEDTGRLRRHRAAQDRKIEAGPGGHRNQ